MLNESGSSMEKELRNFRSGKRKVKMKISCIIPAAGKSSRFKELGRTYPKTILPINEVPIIVNNIRVLRENKIQEIIIVSKEVEVFERILNLYKISDVKIVPPDESKNEGPLTSLYSGWENVSSSSDMVLICLSDIFLTSLPELSKELITYELKDDYSRWCLIQKGKVLDKPKEEPTTFKEGNKFMAINGLYLFKNERIKDLRKIIKNPFKEETQLSFLFSKFIEDIDIELFPLEDIGTLEDYLLKRNLTLRETRYFNSISSSSGIVFKKSQDTNKIISEFNWFRSIPQELAKYTVRTFNLNLLESEYSMEEIYGNNIRERIILLGMETNEINSFLNSFFSYIKEERDFIFNYDIGHFTLDKLSKRSENLNIREDVLKISKILGKYDLKKYGSIMHGDTVLSNIFFNDLNKITLIDPNGQVVGSFLYDLAKLYQSLILSYDFIDMGFFIKHSSGFEILDKGTEKIKDIFLTKLKEEFGEEISEIVKLLSICLIGSLIPLHSDKPQNQEVYIEIFKKEVQKL